VPHNGGKLTNQYDLSGLTERLKKLEPDFRKVEDDIDKARRTASKRGYSKGWTAGEQRPA